MKTKQIHFKIEEETYEKLRAVVFTMTPHVSLGEYIRRLIEADLGNMGATARDLKSDKRGLF